MPPKKDRALHKRLRGAPPENFRNTFSRLKVSPIMPPSTIAEDSSGYSGSHEESTTAYRHGEAPHLSGDQYGRSVSNFSPSTAQAQYRQPFYPDDPTPNYGPQTVTGRHWQPTSYLHYDNYGENNPYTSLQYTVPPPYHDINPLPSDVCFVGYPGVTTVTGECSRCSGTHTIGDGSRPSEHFSEAAPYLPSSQMHVSEPQAVYTTAYQYTPPQHPLPVSVPGQNEYPEASGYYYEEIVTPWSQTQDYPPDSDERHYDNGHGQATDRFRYD